MVVWLVVLLASGVLAQFPSLIAQDEFSILPPLSPSVDNHKCRNDTLLYLEHLKNHTLWAVKMFDSSVKVPVGLLAGSTFQMGHFDECLQVGAEEAPTEVVPLRAPIRAQYCLARIQLSPIANTYPNFTQQNVTHAFNLQYDPRGSMWEKFRVPIDPRKKPRNDFHWAVCVPSSCGSRDVRDGLHAALEPLATRHGVHLDVDVDENLCQTEKSVPYTTGDTIYICVVSIIMAVVLSTTLYDIGTYNHRQKLDKSVMSRQKKMVLAFSAFSNLEKLNKPEKTDDLGVLHGMRLYSMIFVILGHRCRYTYGGPLFNPEYAEERYLNIGHAILFNGAVVVDTFYLLSAFLVTYSMLQTLSKKNKLNLPKLYIHRWLRLTPVYLMVIFFYITLLDNLSDGPFWKTRVAHEQEPCLQNWWANILYINNYINSDRPCMFQSWYLASDMHFYLLAPLLVIPLYRKPILGTITLVSALVVSVIVPFVVTYTGSYNAIIRFYMGILQDPEATEDFYVVYNKSHNRATPYIIGIATAFIYRKLKINKTIIPLPLIIACGATAFTLGLSSLLYVHIFFIPNREYSALENALCNPLQRVTWSMSIAWVIIAACTRNDGILWFLRHIMKIHAFIPLSRLTYCAYLVHGLVQFYSMATLKQAEDLNAFNFIWMTCGDIVMTFIFALFIHIFFEAPVTEFKKIFLEQKPAPVKDYDAENRQDGEVFLTQMTSPTYSIKL